MSILGADGEVSGNRQDDSTILLTIALVVVNAATTSVLVNDNKIGQVQRFMQVGNQVRFFARRDDSTMISNEPRVGLVAAALEVVGAWNDLNVQFDALQPVDQFRCSCGTTYTERVHARICHPDRGYDVVRVMTSP